MDEYGEYRTEKIEQGNEYQDFIMDLFQKELAWFFSCYTSRKKQFECENRIGAEVKNDGKYQRTRRLWIETFEKSHKGLYHYSISGIYRDNIIFYIIGNYEEVFLFTVRELRIMDHETIGEYKISKYIHEENLYRTSKGFLVPEKDAKERCLVYLRKNWNEWEKTINQDWFEPYAKE